MKKRNKYQAGSLVMSKNIKSLESEFSVTDNPRPTKSTQRIAKGKLSVPLGGGVTYTREHSKDLNTKQTGFSNIFTKKLGKTKASLIVNPKAKFVGARIEMPLGKKN